MPRKSKKQLLELKQIDAKEEKFAPTTLSQIFGDTGLDKYKTLDIDKYLLDVKAMSLSDLRRHAIKIGVIPTMNRERIEKQLAVEFRKHYNLYRKPENLNLHPKDLSKDKYKQALNIMSAVK